MRKMLSIAILSGLLAGTAGPALAISGNSPADDARARVEARIGTELFRGGKLIESLDHLAAALNQFPDDVDLLKYLAAAHRRIARGETGNARETEVRMANSYFQRVLAIDSDEHDYLQYAGETFLDMDDVANARAKLAALGALCPSGCAQHDTLAAEIAAQDLPAPPPPPAAP